MQVGIVAHTGRQSGLIHFLPTTAEKWKTNAVGGLSFSRELIQFFKKSQHLLRQVNFLFLTKTSEGYTGRHPFLKALWFRLNTNSSKQILHTLACFNNLYLCFEEGDVVISIRYSL